MTPGSNPGAPTIVSSLFQKVVEDFDCEHCGTHNHGDGYKNHCEKCLWSKHVDVYPGDRAERCSGMMEPIRIEKKNGEDSIVHECLKCGIQRANRVHEGDNKDMIIAIAKAFADKQG